MKTNSKTALIVLFVHFVTIVCFSFDPTAFSKQKKQGPILVRNFRESPRKIEPTTAAPKAKAAAHSPKKLSPTLPKKTTRHEPNKAEPPSKPPKEVPRESPATTQKAASTTTSELKIPTLLPSRQPNEPTTEGRSFEYGPLLSELLKSTLGSLPEFGDVLVALTLEKSGQISSVEIVKSESEKNAEWLKKQLPLLELPCFNDYGIADSELNFTILFRNADPF